jgi:hypothetical protein
MIRCVHAANKSPPASLSAFGSMSRLMSQKDDDRRQLKSAGDTSTQF